MHLFYCQQEVSSQLYSLDREESNHCIKVLRLKQGDFIHITDGRGTLYKCQIEDASSKNCVVKVVDTIKEFEKRDYYIHIAIAPTKNINRLEWFLEKATEIGIDEITPIYCHNSERDSLKTERLDKIIVSAMKQSLKAYIPKLNELTPVETLIENAKEEKKLICYCQDEDRKLIKDTYKPKQSVLILIGPEGDFIPKEVNKALSCGFEKISLGKERLRTETAGVYSAMAIHIINQ
ncbi:MAG: 16S rRNA (uracil(1498)-N(3))-methyltransferase [Bacteroidales bacterium]|jgi:16S rRNA (uracil1498-N3)-methyltransferase|nr:16S rRNA (uracil(1498)-N(3))-methyltransferase [Bacteroidales bacterium]